MGCSRMCESVELNLVPRTGCPKHLKSIARKRVAKLFEATAELGLWFRGYFPFLFIISSIWGL